MDTVLLCFIPVFFLLVLLLVLAALVLLYAFASQLIMWSSGLTRLAERYPVTHEPEGQTFTKQTVQVGAARWKNCVTVGVGPQGLYLAVRRMLTRYPPILVPWDEIKGIQETKLYWQRAIQLSVGDPQVGTITVLTKLFEAIQPFTLIGDG